MKLARILRPHHHMRAEGYGRDGQGGAKTAVMVGATVVTSAKTLVPAAACKSCRAMTEIRLAV